MASRTGVAARALAAQLGAAALVAALMLLRGDGIPGAAPSIWAVVALQGLLAGIIGIVLGASWWWFPIHLLFLPAVLLVHASHLPPAFYLAAFLVLLLFNWGVVQSRVPLYLSRRSAWQQVAALLPADRRYRLLDIGSGLGGMLFYLDKVRPLGVHEGIEISPASWLVSRLRARLLGARARVAYGDYRQLDLSAYDVVFAFLSPVVMDELRTKASQEMRPGALLLSLAFPLPGVAPDLVIPTGDARRDVLYGWRIQPGRLAVPAVAPVGPTRHQPA